MTALQLHEQLRLRRGLIQPASVRYGDNVVAHRVEEQFGDPDLGDLLHRVEPAPRDPAHRYIRIELLPPINDRCQGAIEYHARHREPARQIHRDRRAQRVAEHDNALGRNALLLPEIPIRRLAVPVESRLRWYAVALPIASVVEGQQVEAKLL